jgi:hypothetical protein
MTVALAEPLLRPRRTGTDFVDEASSAAALARANADSAAVRAAQLEAAAGTPSSPSARNALRIARRLRQAAAAYERDAQRHEEAVLVLVTLTDELRRARFVGARG